MVTLSPKTMLRCGIFEDYFLAEFNNYSLIEDEFLSSRKQVLATVLDFCKHIQNAFKEGIGLFFYGSNGSGKTHLEVSALKYCIRQGYTGQLVSMQGAFSAYMDGIYGNEGAKEWFNRRVKNVQVLVIDDALKEYGKVEAIPVFFDNLIRHRMRRNLITIISTNGTIQDFETRYGASFVSLLMAKTIPIRMVWPDYRKEVLSSQVINKLHGI